MLDVWTEDRTKRLVELWGDEKLSARQIGADLGVSRNAVLGKVHRMALPARASSVDPKVQRHSDIDRERRRQAASLKCSGARKKKVEIVPPPAAQPFQNTDTVTFAELRRFSAGDPNQCRFIEGSPQSALYCGAPTAPGKAYCAHHHEITHTTAYALTKDERSRRAKQATKNWFSAAVRLTGIPAEAA